MNIKAIGVATFLVIFLGSANADIGEARYLQKIPSDTDFSSVEVSKNYLRAELGSDFVKNIYVTQYTCTKTIHSIKRFTAQKVHSSPTQQSRFLLVYPERDYSDKYHRNNIGYINTIESLPARAEGKDSCFSYPALNKVVHINANMLFASWVYQGREALKDL